MRDHARRLLAATVGVAASVGLLTACSGQPSPEQPHDPGPSSAGTPDTALPTTAAAERAPLGLEIRYVDAHGKVVVLEPADFPR